MSAKYTKHSFKEGDVLAWIACCECERGGNGEAKDKCASGWTVKRFNGLGCYNGSLRKGLKF